VKAMKSHQSNKVMASNSNWVEKKGSQQLNTFCLENHIIIFSSLP